MSRHDTGIKYILLILLALFASGITQNITIGSTKEEVLKVLGAPSTMHTSMWWYGTSSISFSSTGRVDGYSYGNRDLKIAFGIPEDSVAPNYVTIGANRHDILRVLGKPDTYHSHMWWYGTSSISFSSTGRVDGYSYGNRDLRVRLIARLSEGRTKPIGVDVGATKDEVLMVLGKPDTYHSYMWWYGTSSISFSSTGRVDGYSQGNVDLRIRITPNNKYLSPSDKYGYDENVYTYDGKRYSITNEEEQYSIFVKPTTDLSYVTIESGSLEELEKYKVKDYYSSSYHPFLAENGSYYGQISEYTGRPKTLYVRGYFRKDGTYVRSHFRSKPRR